MSRDLFGVGELEFLQAFVKRGFVNIPRMLFDYMIDLGLDYDTIGKIFTLLACVGISTEIAFGPYVISRRENPHDYDQMRSLVTDLEAKDIVRIEEEGEVVTFTLIPLFTRLRALWREHQQRLEQEVAASGGADPAVLAAERLFGRPLSDREASDIQDWVDSYGFGPEMVQAVVKEGQKQGVTRMTYLNQVARQWSEEGVRTPEEAEQYVQRFRKAAGKHKTIIQYLGIKRQLTGAEQSLLDRWSEEWGFGNEVIMRACDEAAGSQNPLQYVNRVLESWKERGVKSVADVEQLLTEHKRRTVAAADSAKAPKQSRNNAPRNSNVFLKREKKDDSYYDIVFKKYSD